VTQHRNAFNRHSNSHSGSFFFFEIRRTVSSVNPRGAASASTSVTKPYSYSLFTNCSIVSVAVLINVPPHSIARTGCLVQAPLETKSAAGETQTAPQI